MNGVVFDGLFTSSTAVATSAAGRPFVQSWQKRLEPRIGLVKSSSSAGVAPKIGWMLDGRRVSWTESQPLPAR